MKLALLAAALTSLVLACGGSGDPADGGTPDDAGTDGAPRVFTPREVPLIEVAAPTGPAPAALPNLLPCGVGFEEVDLGDGVTGCEPTVGPFRTPCPEGEAHFLGESECAPVGAACGTEAFPAAPAGALHVLQAAGAGGDGTRGAPYGELAEALAVATAGDTVVVGAGDYAPRARIPAGVTVRGVCAGRARIVCDAAAARADALTVDGDDVSVFDLGVVGCKIGVRIPDEASHTYRLSGMTFRGIRRTALALYGGVGVLERIQIRDGESVDGETVTGRGVTASNGAAVTIDGLAIDRAVQHGIMVVGAGTEVVAENVLVTRTRPGPRGLLGDCVYAHGEGALTIRRGYFETCHRTAAVARTGASVVLEDVVGRDVRPEEDDGSEDGVFTARSGGHMTIRRARVEGPFFTGVRARTAGSTLDVEDLVVSTGHEGGPSFGLVCLAGAEVTARRVLIRDLDGAAVAAAATDPEEVEVATLAVEDVTVRRMSGGSAMGNGGQGFVAVYSYEVELRRFDAADVRVSGLQILGTGRVLAEDVRIENVLPDEGMGVVGCGVCAMNGAHLTLNRGLVRNGRGAGVAIGAFGELNPPAHLDGQDLRIEGITDLGEGTGGGLVLDQGTATVARLDISDVSKVSLYVYGSRSEADFRDVLIQDSVPSPGGTYGYGVFVQRQAVATFERLRLLESAAAGFVVSEATASLTAGEVRGAGGASGASGATWAIGIVNQHGGTLALHDTHIADVRGYGLTSSGAGSMVVGRDITVRDVADYACPTCTATTGVGAGSYNGATMRLTNFEVTQSEICNVHVAGGEVDLKDGLVALAPIGASVSTPGFDVGRLTDGVIYYENGVNLDSAALPVPAPLDPVDIRAPGS